MYFDEQSDPCQFNFVFFMMSLQIRDLIAKFKKVLKCYKVAVKEINNRTILPTEIPAEVPQERPEKKRGRKPKIGPKSRVPKFKPEPSPARSAASVDTVEVGCSPSKRNRNQPAHGTMNGDPGPSRRLPGPSQWAEDEMPNIGLRGLPNGVSC
jgi:hypothetical protein